MELDALDFLRLRDEDEPVLELEESDYLREEDLSGLPLAIFEGGASRRRVQRLGSERGLQLSAISILGFDRVQVWHVVVR